jgi:hypothetical protein
MPYPLSTDVTAGSPTAYQHYNNLRSDALRFGNPEADAANLGALMSMFQQNLSVEYLAVNRLRVPASLTLPVGVMVGGVPLLVSANVDLPSGASPSGPATTWYIFAVRSAGSTAFTLDTNTSSVETSSRRCIGDFYWDGTQIVPKSIHMYYADHLAAVMNAFASRVCQGRLTLTLATPVTAADVTGAGTLYFTPFMGTLVSLYKPNAGWVMHEFAEINISLAGKGSGNVYDVFLYDANSGLALDLVVWASATTRGTALVLQDGVYVKSGEPQYRYIGTIRASGSGVTEDSKLKRFVWNYYNRQPRQLKVVEATDSWTYATNTWRNWNNNAANRVEYVCGMVEDLMSFHFIEMNNCGGTNYRGIGIALDSSAPSGADLSVTFRDAGYDKAQVLLYGPPVLGYHYLQLCEISAASSTFYGDLTNAPYDQYGAVGFIPA